MWVLEEGHQPRGGPPHPPPILREETPASCLPLWGLIWKSIRYGTESFFPEGGGSWRALGPGE